MNPIIWFSIIGASTLVVFLTCIISQKARKKQEYRQHKFEPFVVSEYYTRMEKATLDILEIQEPVGQTITLWLGLDGLMMNEDGTLEWIRQRKPKQVSSGMFYQTCQSTQMANLLQSDFSQIQSTNAQIDALMAQYAMQNVNERLPLQSYQVGYLGYYPSYLYGGIMTGYAHPRYFLQDCCCSRLI